MSKDTDKTEDTKLSETAPAPAGDKSPSGDMADPETGRIPPSNDSRPSVQAKPPRRRTPGRSKPGDYEGKDDNAGGSKKDYIDLTTSKDNKKDAVVIKLFQNESVPPNGQPFGVNGRFFALRAETWYRVPGWLLDTIDNCVEDKPVVDDNNRFVGTRPQTRFPYTKR